MVLARLLLPSQFGLIGMISIFVSIGKLLVDSGLTQSLIRNKELDQEDYSTVFFFNLSTSIVIYIIIFLAAPFIAHFYNQPLLTNILRLFCLSFIFDSFSAVQRTKMTKQMNFRIQTIISIPSTIFGGIVGLALAYNEFGVWSLVWSTLATSIAGSIQFWIYSRWAPSLTFSFAKFKEHFLFGYKLTLSGLLDKFFSNLYLIVIGKYFSPAQVGFYARAETMKQLPVLNISTALNKVTYPLFSSIQDDDVKLKNVYRRLMKTVVYIIAPVLIFLAVLAVPTFRFLFTEKWLPAAPYFQIMCLTGILHPVHSYNLNILKVKGRTDLFLRLEVIKKSIIAITVLFTLNLGIYALLYGQIIISLLSFIVNTYYTGKFLKYSAWQQTRDIVPIIILSCFAGTIIYGIDQIYLFKYMDIIRILIGGSLGVLIYLSISFMFRIESFIELRKIIIK